MGCLACLTDLFFLIMCLLVVSCSYLLCFFYCGLLSTLYGLGTPCASFINSILLIKKYSTSLSNLSLGIGIIYVAIYQLILLN